MDNNYYNNNNNNNTNSNSNYNNNNSNNSNNNSSNQYSDSFYSYNNQQNHGNQNNTQNDSTGSKAGGYGSTQSSIYGSQSNSHGSGYGTTQNNSQSTGYGNAQSNNQSTGYGNAQSNNQSTGYGSTQSNNQSYGYGSTQNKQQSAGYENTKSNQQNTGYGTTQNNQQSTGYGNQNGNYGTYGSNTSYQSYAYGSNPKPEKKKKERKPGGFGKQLAKCAALALVFGLVAGGVMTGVNYASGKVLGTTNAGNVQASLTTGDDSTVQPTAISSSYVATDVSDIVDEVMPSIVAITNVSQTEYQSFWGQSKTYESTSCGSGIIVSQDKEYLYVATNNHVVEGANSLTVTFANDDTVSAEIKGTDPSTDLAVVKVALSSIKDDTMSAIKVATLGSSDTLKVGESCIAIGNALGYGQSVTTGVISALNREVSVSDSSSSTNYTAELIQTDAAINPGNSGGALLNTAGEVIGINSVKYSDTSVEGIGYAIPVDTAKPIIEELITKEKVDESNSAYLGIAGVDVTSDVAKTYNMPTGVYVAQVMEGAAAEQAGIQKGDIITKFDGKDVTSMEELSSNMQYYAAGTTVDVVIERSSNGQYEEHTISVTLGKKN
jgi:serine protease Do